VQPVRDEGVRKLEHGVGIEGLGRCDEDELVDFDGGGEGGDAPALLGLPKIRDAEVLCQKGVLSLEVT
jgi:hypothetical protein